MEIYDHQRESRRLYLQAATALQKHILNYPQRYKAFHLANKSELDQIANALNKENVEDLLMKSIKLEQQLRPQDPVKVDKNVATTYNELGMVYRLQNNFPQAEDCFLQGIEILSKHDSSDAEIKFALKRAFHDLAEILFFQKRFRDAKDILNKRLALQSKIWDWFEIRETNRFLKIIEQEQSRQ